MKHIKLFEQFLNERKLNKKDPGYEEALTTVKTQKSLFNYIKKSKKALESLSQEGFKSPIVQKEYIAQKTLEGVAALQSLINCKVSSYSGMIYVSPLNNGQFEKSMAYCASIELGFDELEIYTYHTELETRNDAQTSEFSVAINYNHDLEKSGEWAKDDKVLASNSNEIIEFLSDPKFIKLLQNHVNACTEYVTAIQ